MASPRRRARRSRTCDPRAEFVANATCVVGIERTFVRIQSRDIPALTFTRTEVAIFECGLRMRRDAFAARSDRIRAREIGSEGAGRIKEVVAKHESAEIVRGRIAHPADRDPDRIRIATARMRRVGCVTGPYVAHVPTQIVRR